MSRLRLLAAGGILMLSAATTIAADPSTKLPFYLEEAAAGPDFAVQGEYEGTIGKKVKVGAQVIALGDGKFEAVLLAKGLPGAGWDLKSRVPLSGETKDGKTTFSGKNFRGTIENGVFSGTAEEDVAFEMKKVSRTSTTLGAAPPENAIVLVDGPKPDVWATAEFDDAGLLKVPARTKEKFSDFQLHLEFRTPFMPTARGQARGNSGVYLLDQYEVQVLDSFGLEGKDNECGGIYKASAPKVHMCLPPLTWQTYDIEFTAAKFDDAGKKTADAVVTVRHNGVLIHDQLVLKSPTPGGGQNDEKPGELFLQDHRDPVRYRNIWIVEKK